VTRVGALLLLLFVMAGTTATPSTPFRLATSTFRSNGPMPKSASYNAGGCTGANRSPELHWNGAPYDTRSFVLIVHDPDAPLRGGWYHWVVYNLPAGTHAFERGARIPRSHLGLTSWNRQGYGGPCPPPGRAHHYRFSLYALNVRELNVATPTGPELRSRMRGHILAVATLTGTYRR